MCYLGYSHITATPLSTSTTSQFFPSTLSDSSADQASHPPSSSKITPGMAIATSLSALVVVALLALGLWFYKKRAVRCHAVMGPTHEPTELDGQEVRRAELATAANIAELDSKEKREELESVT